MLLPPTHSVPLTHGHSQPRNELVPTSTSASSVWPLMGWQAPSCAPGKTIAKENGKLVEGEERGDGLGRLLVVGFLLDSYQCVTFACSSHGRGKRPSVH